MQFRFRRSLVLQILLGLGLLMMLWPASAQPQLRPVARQFTPGSWSRTDQLPPGRLRTQLERLPAAARDHALQWLQGFHFPEADTETLQVDAAGGVFYADDFTRDASTAPTASALGSVGSSALVSPFPANLIFHSRRGAPNVIYLNFTGENVSGTSWNASVGRTLIPAVAFSLDSDYSSFSDAEQQAIKRIWQRIAEDYSPFDVDVTTERPASFGLRTGNVLITRSTDANGAANPSSTAGGVAYISVFGTSSYANYRPAWIYVDNLASDESYIAEAASHEFGHNVGLSHDGTTTTAYYAGHGSGDTSWAPIMGTSYGRNVTQWSKGEYYLANNSQDDLVTLSGKLPYRADDWGNSPANASALVFTSETNVVSTTPENDPANLNPANKGILERADDVDVFSFLTGPGAVNLTVSPWISAGSTRGGNLDIVVELQNEAGVVLMTNNPASQTVAAIQTTLAAGRYFLAIHNTGVGNPMSSTPTGYTSYGTLGQYFISGYVAPSNPQELNPPMAQLQISDVVQGGIGAKPFTVTYSGASAIDISTIDSSDIHVVGPNGFDAMAELIAIDAPDNGTPRVATYSVAPPSGTNWVQTDSGIYTVSIEPDQVRDLDGKWVASGELGQFTVNVPASTMLGANGIPLWQSAVAGLDPNDPHSQLRLEAQPATAGLGDVLSWNTVTGRVYTLWFSPGPDMVFTPIPSATQLPSAVQSFTNTVDSSSPLRFYRLQVELP